NTSNSLNHLARPPARRKIGNIIEVLENIVWDYIKYNFENTYKKTYPARRMKEALSLISSDKKDIESYWYPWLANSLPFAQNYSYVARMHEIYCITIKLRAHLKNVNLALFSIKDPGNINGDISDEIKILAECKSHLITELTLAYIRMFCRSYSN